MPSTYSPSLKLELIGAGEQAGVWNVTTNNNLGGLLEQAIAGRTTVNVTAGDVTLTSLNGVVDEARSAVLAVTGTPGVTRAIIIPDASKSYTVINTTTNIVQIKTAAGVAFNCAPSATSVVSCDGSNGVQGSTIASLTSPVLTGTPTAPTAAQGTNTTQIATTAFVNAEIAADTANLAPISSPTFTGVPAAPTAAVNTNTTQLATTAFVNAEIANDAPTKTGGGASGTWGINVTGNAATTSQTNFSNLTINSSQVLSAANYNSYAPTLTGVGASGTWGINVSGNAASVTNGVYNNGGTYGINISGNAASVTNGVYNNGATYGINISGNAATATNATNAGNANTVTNGVYNNGGTYSINILGNANNITQYSINQNLATSSTPTFGTTFINGNLNILGGRQIYLDNGGATFIRGDAGGYNLVYAFMTANGSPFGGFGAFGAGDAPSYFYVANAAVSVGVQLPYGGNAWVAISDITRKNVAGEIENALAKVNTLDAIYYNYKVDEPDTPRRVGLIAQQVREVLPEATTELDMEAGEGTEKVLTLAYTDVVPLLVAAVKELTAKVEQLQAEVNTLKGNV